MKKIVQNSKEFEEILRNYICSTFESIGQFEAVRNVVPESFSDEEAEFILDALDARSNIDFSVVAAFCSPGKAGMGKLASLIKKLSSVKAGQSRSSAGESMQIQRKSPGSIWTSSVSEGLIESLGYNLNGPMLLLCEDGEQSQSTNGVRCVPVTPWIEFASEMDKVYSANSHHASLMAEYWNSQIVPLDRLYKRVGELSDDEMKVHSEMLTKMDAASSISSKSSVSGLSRYIKIFRNIERTFAKLSFAFELEGNLIKFPELLKLASRTVKSEPMMKELQIKAEGGLTMRFSECRGSNSIFVSVLKGDLPATELDGAEIFSPSGKLLTVISNSNATLLSSDIRDGIRIRFKGKYLGLLKNQA